MLTNGNSLFNSSRIHSKIDSKYTYLMFIAYVQNFQEDTVFKFGILSSIIME